MDLQRRKPNRISKYDYSQNGAYFVTVCTKDRKKILSDIVGDDAHIVPKPYGSVAEKYIYNVPEIEKYVTMPDHIHMIIRLDGGVTPSSFPVKGCKPNRNVSSIVRSIKTLTTKELGEAIFQRSYYDHVIRNQRDYNEVWEYIENNPRKWVASQQEE